MGYSPWGRRVGRDRATPTHRTVNSLFWLKWWLWWLGSCDGSDAVGLMVCFLKRAIEYQVEEWFPLLLVNNVKRIRMSLCPPDTSLPSPSLSSLVDRPVEAIGQTSPLPPGSATEWLASDPREGGEWSEGTYFPGSILAGLSHAASHRRIAHFPLGYASHSFFSGWVQGQPGLSTILFLLPTACPPC